jgi:serine protease Do
MSKRRRWVAGLGAIGIGSAVAVQSLLGMNSPLASLGKAETAPPAAVQSANDLSIAFRYASEKVLPSVVTIRAAAPDIMPSADKGLPGRPGLREDGIPEEMRPFLKRFFGDEMPQFPRPMPFAPHAEGMGSGVIIDSSGLVLTNHHVAGGGGKVFVQLHDGREFEAVEVKTDPKTDIAIVRIEGAGDLPAAVLGDSDQLQIGDWVLAVGAPFGLKETVTAGIISAKSRGIGITERADFLQTDAAINPGNSGGPLVNLRGEVVGINTAISTRGGGNDGVGFAVPINQAQWVSRQLVESGSVQRAFLGVGIQGLTSELSKQFGLTAVQGALVTEVRPGTAAEQAGLQSGDVIVEFDGRAIDSPHSLQNVVERAALNKGHSLVIVRNGARKTIEVNLQPLPEALASADHGESGSTDSKPELKALGLEVSDLTADVAQQLGLKDASGVVVTSVEPGSAAERAGLGAGTIIGRVGSTNVTSVAEFRAAVKDVDLDAGVLLLVRTAQGSRFVVLKA